MTEPKPPKDNEPFVQKLLQCCGGEAHRAARAELRRYWSPATRHQSWAMLGRLGTLRANYTSPETILAALFAIHPLHVAGGNRLGQAALKLAGGGQKSDSFDSFDRHFRRLLACEDGNLNELSQYLQRLVKRLEREGVPLDYNALLWDLRKWHNHAENVKSEWARQFYQAPSENQLTSGEGAA